MSYFSGSGLYGTRRWLVVFSISAIYVALSLNLAAQTARSDWPEYHHDNNRSGVNSKIQ